jgi:signal transduction histidine kinase
MSDENTMRPLHIDLIRAQYLEDGNLGHEEFLALLSHEMRTPLGALLAASEVLAAASPGSADDAEARAVVARQTRQLACVLDELLEVGRAVQPARGPSTIERAPVSLN